MNKKSTGQILYSRNHAVPEQCAYPQVLSPEEQVLAARNDYNFDHPDAFDFDLLTHTLRKLKQGKSVKIPVYDFTTHGRQKEWVRRNLHSLVCCIAVAFLNTFCHVKTTKKFKGCYVINLHKCGA